MDFELSKILQMALDNLSLKTFINKAKRFHKPIVSDVINALACDYCLPLTFTEIRKCMCVCTIYIMRGSPLLVRGGHKQSNVPLRSGIQGVV